MSVPDYQSLMLPLLKLASNEKEHSLQEATRELALESKNSLKLIWLNYYPVRVKLIL